MSFWDDLHAVYLSGKEASRRTAFNNLLLKGGSVPRRIIGYDASIEFRTPTTAAERLREETIASMKKDLDVQRDKMVTEALTTGFITWPTHRAFERGQEFVRELEREKEQFESYERSIGFNGITEKTTFRDPSTGRARNYTLVTRPDGSCTSHYDDVISTPPPIRLGKFIEPMFLIGHWTSEETSTTKRSRRIMTTNAAVIDFDNIDNWLIPITAEKLLEHIQSQRARCAADLAGIDGRVKDLEAVTKPLHLTVEPLNTVEGWEDSNNFMFAYQKGKGPRTPLLPYHHSEHVTKELKDLLIKINTDRTVLKSEEQDLERKARLLSVADPSHIVYIDSDMAGRLNFAAPPLPVGERAVGPGSTFDV